MCFKSVSVDVMLTSASVASILTFCPSVSGF